MMTHGASIVLCDDIQVQSLDFVLFQFDTGNKCWRANHIFSPLKTNSMVGKERKILYFILYRLVIIFMHDQ